MRNIYMLSAALTLTTVSIQAAEHSDIAHIVAFNTNKNAEPSELFYSHSEHTADNRLAIVAAYSDEPKITHDILKNLALEFLDIEKNGGNPRQLRAAHHVALEESGVPQDSRPKAINVTCIVLSPYIMHLTCIRPGPTKALFSYENHYLYPLPAPFFSFNDTSATFSGDVQDHVTAQQKAKILHERNPEQPFHGTVSIRRWKELSNSYRIDRKKELYGNTALSIKQAFGVPARRKNTL